MIFSKYELFTWWFGREVNRESTGCFNEIVYSIYLLSFKLYFPIYLLYLLLSILAFCKRTIQIFLCSSLARILIAYCSLLSTLCTHGFKLCCSVEKKSATQEFYEQEFFKSFANQDAFSTQFPVGMLIGLSKFHSAIRVYLS